MVTAQNLKIVKSKTRAGLIHFPSPDAPENMNLLWSPRPSPSFCPCDQGTLKCQYFRIKDFIFKISPLNKSTLCVCMSETEKEIDNVHWSFQTANLGMWEWGQCTESRMSQPLKEQRATPLALQPACSLSSYIQLWNAVPSHPCSICWIKDAKDKSPCPTWKRLESCIRLLRVAFFTIFMVLR